MLDAYEIGRKEQGVWARMKGWGLWQPRVEMRRWAVERVVQGWLGLVVLVMETGWEAEAPGETMKER